METCALRPASQNHALTWPPGKGSLLLLGGVGPEQANTHRLIPVTYAENRDLEGVHEEQAGKCRQSEEIPSNWRRDRQTRTHIIRMYYEKVA